ncbi:MAG: hypothetical protein WC526_00465 [Patescibacteria group bacterium]
MKFGFKIKHVFLLAVLGILCFTPVFAETTNSDINVQLTVPQGNSGGGEVTPPTDNAPVISGVTTSTSFSSADISWSATDDHGITTVSFVYGTSLIYGNSGTVVGTYGVSLSGLTDATLYYFKISVTDTASQTTVYTGTFQTLSLSHPAPNISFVQVLVGMTTATINWVTDQQADSQVNYGLTSAYGNTVSESALILVHSINLSGLIPDTTYHFRIISTNSYGSSTSTADAVFKTNKDTIPPPDVSNVNLTTTTNSINLTWENPSLGSVPDFAGVKVVRKIGSPSANISDGTLLYTGTGEFFNDTNPAKDIDYFYTIFSFDTSENYSPGVFRSGRLPTIIPPPIKVEICNNGMDDDENGLVDCNDPVCISAPNCQITPPPTTTPPEQPPETEKPPESSVPTFLRINLSDLLFLVGNRQIRLVPSGDIFSSLAGITLSVGVPANVLAMNPQSMVVKIGTDQHQFVYDSGSKVYFSNFSFPSWQNFQAYVEIDYGSGQLDSVGFKLNGLPWGVVSDNSGNALPDVNVTLLRTNGSTVSVDQYGELNPLVSGAGGAFGWMVPNGAYSLSFSKDGYYDASISSLNVSNNTINSRVSLIKRPPKLLEDIKPEAPLAENAVVVAKNILAQTKAISEVTVQKINEVVQNPVVQQTNQQVVVPTAIAVVAIGAIPLISWIDLLPLLRLLFLQPLLLFGGKKREKWGMVYNSLNKLPVDLAIVRLINIENNKLVQSKVTDAQGHYIFIVDSGKYKIEVVKNNFVFPSALLAGFQSDGQKVDIYHGEVIEVTDSGASVTVNIPLDPAGEYKRPSRLIWESIGRKLQVVLSWLGLIVTAISLYISPKWYIGALLAVHIILFFLFRRLSMPPKTKSWGIVYNDANKQPIGRVVARLFNSQFNKLVSTQVTDNKGRYSFLAGDDSYYITYEHKDYQPHKTENIDLHGKNSEAVAPDVELKKH